MISKDIEKIKIILHQYKGPIRLSYQTKAVSNISESIVKWHIENIGNFNNYSINDLFSLYYTIKYALDDLGEDEFDTVTGLYLYQDGYQILNKVKKMIK